MNNFIEFSMRGAIIALGVISLIALIRVLIGPTAANRVIGVNVITTNVVLIIVLLSYLADSYVFIDVALAYVLCAFVGTLCVVKVLQAGKLD